MAVLDLRDVFAFDGPRCEPELSTIEPQVKGPVIKGNLFCAGNVLKNVRGKVVETFTYSYQCEDKLKQINP